MAGRVDFVLRGVGVVVVAGVLAGGGAYVVGDEPAEDPTANIWIEDGAGACTGGRSSTPIVYADSASPDRRCGTFDQAWDAMSSGDTARIRDGAYAPQCIDGNKTSDTKLIGEDGVVVGDGGTFECVAVFGGDSTVGIEGDYFWLEDVELDAGDEASIGGNTRVFEGADNVTFVNVDSVSDFSYNYIEGDNFEYRGGELWQSDSPPQEVCFAGGGNTFWLLGASAVIDGVTIGTRNVQDVPGPCGGAEDDVPHLENFRLEGGADGSTIKNTYFEAGSEVGSGHIFTTAGAINITLLNNYFGTVVGSYWAQISSVSGWTIAYNTFEQTHASSGGTTGFVWVGNLGVAQGCAATHTKNVWSGSGSCGTDTYTGGTFAALNIDASGNLESDSPAIDAAETPGASDYCTDAATVNSLDRGGTVRPQGSICDAGWDEYGG